MRLRAVGYRSATRHRFDVGYRHNAGYAILLALDTGV